jgi:hypothetical protein
MDCPSCGSPVPNGTHGQTRTYCSTKCRKAAELDARAERKVAKFQAAIGDVATRDELLELLWAAAREGSVSAMRALLEELRRDPAATGSTVIDELARRRGRSGS